MILLIVFDNLIKNYLRVDLLNELIIFLFFYSAIKCKADHTTSQQPEKEAHCSNQRVLSNYFIYVRFPREDLNAPRMKIVKRECPAEFSEFVSCV